MTARRLDGREIAAQIQKELKVEVARLKAEHGLVPGLATVLVGENPASISYVRGKRRACEELGLYAPQLDFAASLSTQELLQIIGELNCEEAIHGILVQLPLPAQDEQQVLNAIDPEKDVDGLHPVNLGRLLRQEGGFVPCTPHGVMQLLWRSGIEVEGRHAVVVGRSTLVGRPLANLLARKAPGANATVTLCHTGTGDLGHFTRQADILVVAAGRPRAIKADMVKEGAVVIDVGINKIEDPSRERGWRLVGDVDYAEVRHKASAITPVPNGVGPMTIAMLLYNAIWAAKRARGIGPGG
jgi:methylenetetrahydrofolate dehydrogenase (NADP+)/methenyltetrahydrofolate cyclohydrolase